MCVSEKTNLPQKEVDLKPITKASLSAFKNVTHPVIRFRRQSLLYNSVVNVETCDNVCLFFPPGVDQQTRMTLGRSDLSGKMHLLLCLQKRIYY